MCCDMDKKIIKIWPDDDNVTLISCPNISEKAEAAVLVLPGGGYNLCAPPEGEPVAERFAEMGYFGYTLNYSTRFGAFDNIGKEVNSHTLFPEPLREVAAAVSYIRKERGNIPVVLIGFSAGGHLASCYSNLWNNPEVYEGITENIDELKPDVCILGYAATELTRSEVIMKAIYGDKADYSDDEIHRYMSKELVGEQTSPTFLFHSITDPMVPVHESVDYAQALAQYEIAHELHLFGCGGHAYALAEEQPMGKWVEMADTFIRNVLSQPLEYNKAEVKRMSEEQRRSFRPNKSK